MGHLKVGAELLGDRAVSTFTSMDSAGLMRDFCNIFQIMEQCQVGKKTQVNNKYSFSPSEACYLRSSLEQLEKSALIKKILI